MRRCPHGMHLPEAPSPRGERTGPATSITRFRAMHYDARHRRPLAVGHMMRGRAERKGGGILRVRCCRQSRQSRSRWEALRLRTRTPGGPERASQGCPAARSAPAAGMRLRHSDAAGMAPARSERAVVRPTDRMDRGWNSAVGALLSGVSARGGGPPGRSARSLPQRAAVGPGISHTDSPLCVTATTLRRRPAGASGGRSACRRQRRCCRRFCQTMLDCSGSATTLRARRLRQPLLRLPRALLRTQNGAVADKKNRAIPADCGLIIVANEGNIHPCGGSATHTAKPL